MAAEHIWPGQWVTDRLGVTLTGSPGLPGLVGLAVRDNPRRAHLLVSTVLGKHVPQHPKTVRDAGLTLGHRVRALLGEEDAARALVLGYAETATGLGHCVADGLGAARCLHSTRRRVPGMPDAGGFEEEHSHATSHRLLPADPGWLTDGAPLVLVDDELSTGRTIRNTVEALHRRAPRERYVVAALVDVRDPAGHDDLAKAAADLGTTVDVVSLAHGRVALPADVLARGRRLVADHTTAPPTPADGHRAPRITLDWPAGLPDGGRHGFTAAHRDRLEAALPALTGQLRAALPPGARRVLVLGSEELMYVPLRLAEALADRLPGTDVRFSATTRSPVLAVDHPGYPIRSRLVFPSHDDPADGPGDRYAYNVAGAGFDAVVAVTDTAGDTGALHAPGGLLSHLAAHTPHPLLAVIHHKGDGDA
ncbi:hypothetical protein SCATT_14720 [Streptantibioticus cattleyicolor NRRL 8057 = DSM 46488]|uniref:Phosphoribosyltransferase n=1 Tax=Streptantibioticus cattleyicolor (strain ATCC 35852 / DSM 46488 / JCM 4925 / NBRC 14057 / NRRL 8057) TaxID=1003195 RepID=F8K489_STREN|nr:hypothetical protein SCATT_14720 [Streptantibioticus cattleyicolor NRRL 8057 = DSM 46488]MYS58527.1 hypothetical protein [Streptomyces sp. SID5468]CCB74191.1 conserved protein of unknown function [Streptantibioticus cattleyicolor NRRL 8057 = DSM 46488]